MVATIEYRRLDSLGRLNGPTLYLDVTSDRMPGGRGRPSTMSYLTCSTLDLDANRPVRIVTAGGAIHSVTLDDDDDLVVVWESKADQRAVVVALLETIAAMRTRLDALGDTDA